MTLADDLRHRVAEQHYANLEFAKDDYRLSLNPIAGHHQEVGLVLWRGGKDGPIPIVTGRALPGRLLLDLAPDGPANVETAAGLIASVFASDQVPQPTAGSAEETLPTRTATELLNHPPEQPESRPFLGTEEDAVRPAPDRDRG